MTEKKHPYGKARYGVPQEVWDVSGGLLGDLKHTGTTTSEGIGTASFEVPRKLKTYTFTQPVRGGHYYIAVKAEDNAEAAAKVVDIVGKLRKPLTDRLSSLSVLEENETLILPLNQRSALETRGEFWEFHPDWYPKHRAGHKGFLPE